MLNINSNKLLLNIIKFIIKIVIYIFHYRIVYTTYDIVYFLNDEDLKYYVSKFINTFHEC